MSEGTSLEDIEAGNIANQADSATMNAILSDMNALPEEPPAQVYQPPPPPPQLPSMHIAPMMDSPMGMYAQPEPDFGSMGSHPMDFGMYTPDPGYMTPQHIPSPVNNNNPVSTPSGTKQNGWSSFLAILLDGLLVSILVCVLSLPVLHTRLSKHVTWAYKVGGELSWTGLALLSLTGGLFYVAYRQFVPAAKIVDFVNTL